MNGSASKKFDRIRKATEEKRPKRLRILGAYMPKEVDVALVPPNSGPLLAVSGTAVRRRLRAGRSVRYLVPGAVIAYIGDHDLYQS